MNLKGMAKNIILKGLKMTLKIKLELAWPFFADRRRRVTCSFEKCSLF